MINFSLASPVLGLLSNKPGNQNYQQLNFGYCTRVLKPFTHIEENMH